MIIIITVARCDVDEYFGRVLLVGVMAFEYVFLFVFEHLVLVR
jgi:hypothetical protein